MRALLQRVTRAEVSVAGETVGTIGPGLLALICAMPGDTPETAAKLAGRIARLRIFRDAEGRMNLPVTQAGASVLAISQFTLAADLRTGNRPGFSRAAPPDAASALFDAAVAALRAEGLHVETGRFGAEMQVSLTNDGPVTIWLDTDDRA